jgi:hypothetical protein
MLQHDSDAKEELKRADHLLYVTLKYTKNIDVIRNAIRRLINACDYTILDVAEWLKEKKKIKNISLMPTERALEVKKHFRKLDLLEFIDFYLILKRIDRAEYTRKAEYKKGVKLIAMDENEESWEVDIEKLYEFFEKTKEFVRYVEENYK